MYFLEYVKDFHKENFDSIMQLYSAKMNPLGIKCIEVKIEYDKVYSVSVYIVDKELVGLDEYYGYIMYLEITRNHNYSTVESDMFRLKKQSEQSRVEVDETFEYSIWGYERIVINTTFENMKEQLGV